MFHKSFVFKILIAGDGGVGKTTLLRRFVDGVFDESTIETVGVDFFLKELKFEELRIKCSLQLWDLGGQERFRHLLDSFIMGARAALLLFDLTRMPKMNNILDWVNIVRLHDITLPIMLVGTKLDLEDAIAVDDEYAYNIKNTFNMLNYFKTSSKNAYNVNEVFEALAKELMKKSKY
ncbi:MAG: Rab family GTPase [Candidatus Thorarchaeota archaeon]